MQWLSTLRFYALGYLALGHLADEWLLVATPGLRFIMEPPPSTPKPPQSQMRAFERKVWAKVTATTLRELPAWSVQSQGGPTPHRAQDTHRE